MNITEMYEFSDIQLSCGVPNLFSGVKTTLPSPKPAVIDLEIIEFPHTRERGLISICSACNSPIITSEDHVKNRVTVIY